MHISVLSAKFINQNKVNILWSKVALFFYFFASILWDMLNVGCVAYINIGIRIYDASLGQDDIGFSGFKRRQKEHK